MFFDVYQCTTDLLIINLGILLASVSIMYHPIPVALNIAVAVVIEIEIN